MTACVAVRSVILGEGADCVAAPLEAGKIVVRAAREIGTTSDQTEIVRYWERMTGADL